MRRQSKRLHYTWIMWIFRLPGTLDAREVDLDTLWSAGAQGLEEHGETVLAYFSEKMDVPLLGEWTEEPDQDWQEGWKKDLKPVQAGAFAIAPPWLASEVPPGQRPLLIEVGMAFGTGHHETTRLAVEALSERSWALQPRVLDVGTGSGVLALAAALLGAGEVIGVDIDPVTIPAAEENARLNGFLRLDDHFVRPGSAGTLTFMEGTLSEVPAAQPFDVLVANLYAELHDILMSQYREVIAPGGQVVLTGILTGKLPLVLDALAREGFQNAQSRTQGDWVLVVAQA